MQSLPFEDLSLSPAILWENAPPDGREPASQASEKDGLLSGEVHPVYPINTQLAARYLRIFLKKTMVDRLIVVVTFLAN